MHTPTTLPPRAEEVRLPELQHRPSTRRIRLMHAAAGLALAAALAACSSAASTAGPGDSAALPSVDTSAAASAGTQAALGAIDRVDSAIDANQTGAGLTADDVASLKSLTASIRTALQTGDTSAARAAVDQLSTKVGSMSAALSTDAAKQLSDAVAAVKTALEGG